MYDCASDVLCKFYKFRLRHLSINVDLRAVHYVLSHSILMAHGPFTKSHCLSIGPQGNSIVLDKIAFMTIFSNKPSQYLCDGCLTRLLNIDKYC